MAFKGTWKRSKGIHNDAKFRVVTLFPRRPKLSENGEIFVTINNELSIVKNIGENHGVTVLAGCPIATDFWELSSCKEFAWFDVNHPDVYEYLVRIESMTHGARLMDDDIIELVKRSTLHSMSSLENFIRSVRDELPSSFFGARYKPVYFLIKEH